MIKPVILTVDDDREVLAAIERDLKIQYRQRYRIVAAGDAGRSARGRAGVEAPEHPRRVVPRRSAHAGHDRDAVAHRGPEAVSRGRAGAAHGLRRHGSGDCRHQRRRDQSLPAEAVGSAGAEAVSGPGRSAGGVVGARSPAVRWDPRHRFALVAAELRGARLSRAQPGAVPMGGSRHRRARARDRQDRRRRPAEAAGGAVSRRDVAGGAVDGGSGGQGRPARDGAPARSTTWRSSAAVRRGWRTPCMRLRRD